MAHILNAEGEKLQKAIELADNICDLLKVNQSVQQTVTKVTFLEQVLYAKLEALECCRFDCPTDNSEPEFINTLIPNPKCPPGYPVNHNTGHHTVNQTKAGNDRSKHQRTHP